MQIKKGDIAELKINKYAFEGKGIAKVSKNKLLGINEPDENENYVVFVNGAYPGDVVKASLKKIKKSYAEADSVEIINSSPERTAANCKYFGVCGGCKQQDLNYQSQIKYKQLQVVEIFERLGRFANIYIDPIIPSDNIYNYRNKMEFSFTEKRWLSPDEIRSDDHIDSIFGLGLHIPKFYEKVLDIDECFLHPVINNAILNFTRDFFKSTNTSIYSTKTHRGYLRNLVIKNAFHTDDIMVNLVTSCEDELITEYASKLIKAIPQITTFINNINKKKAAVATGDYENVLHGPGFIYDTIGKYKFRISANSFFQTNTLQAEKLYQTALEFAELEGNEIVYDLYSGAGTIASFISDHCKEVYGFESEKSAVNDANDNIQMNNINNVTCYVTDLYDSFLPFIESENIPKPDVIIADPPRSGMHKNTV
ncbi:MAG TPA: 23S rRNA (uracil(1939)-C(5))-methyltransferase RlmD, partial [Ignavibacteriaceae bacterium]|nr:23S rRNA (uracil(1939)-C(5))-methyltransferase RlmD [Ignavibacteriaceae bacterium]